MNATRIETTVERDGELHLTQLPCRKGDRVEAIVLVLPDPAHAANDRKEQARQQFLSRAKNSTFRSNAPFPSRDELHERH